jgi:phosphoglycolate phosphatase (TIGR01487 family)
MSRPLALDIDGTITTPDGRIDPRAVTELHNWDQPVVLATGMAFPYPVVLCRFLDIPEIIVAENGGITCVKDEIHTEGDRKIAWKVIDEYRDHGGETDWGRESSINRWRKTEAVVSPDGDEELLRSIAKRYDLDVVYTGYAYHIKRRGLNKGEGLRSICNIINIDPNSFIAIGDSANDIEMFDVAGDSFAVGNCDQDACEAAETVLQNEFMDGVLSVMQQYRV